VSFVTDLPALFTQVFAKVAAMRTALSLPALVPSNLPNFQIGGEFAPQAQVAPRIVIVPTSCEYDYSQQMPTTQTPQNIGRLARKSAYRRWMYFDAQFWGDPDLTARPSGSTAPGIPDPSYGFNSTIELEREFLIAFTSLIGSAKDAWQPMRSEWTAANVGNNRYGRLLILSFRVATPVTEIPYDILPYSQTPNDGGVTGTINVEAELPGHGTPQPVATFVVPPPDPDAP
jgi:hypothetical protein